MDKRDTTELIDVDYGHLIQSYLNVCNQSLRNNQDRFPFKQIFEAAKNIENGRKVEVSVNQSADTFVFEIINGSITAKPHGACGNCDCQAKWAVTDDYLFDVVGNPDVYIDNPAKINWEWMYN